MSTTHLIAADNSAELLDTFRQRVEKLRKEIISAQHAKINIEEVVYQTSQKTDEILITAWQAHTGSQSAITLLAVGGYGRSELNIHSDIDLLFLHAISHKAAEKLEAYGLEDFIRFLWDIGLEVGHSVRTIDECLALADTDITIMTNMLESRLLQGDKVLYDRFDQELRQNSSWTNKTFYQAKRNEQILRHERFDDTTYKLEPNIKKSPGGLRDIQTISWMANKIFGTSDPDSLFSLGFLTEDELAIFKQSRNTLWSIRNELHILAQRSEDRLLFSHQQDIAALYGYTDQPGLLAIEQLMQQYYRAAHDIRRLNQLIIQLIDESLLEKKNADQQKISEHFYIRNGYLAATSNDIFEQKSYLLLDVFVQYQRHHTLLKGFGANCLRSIRKAVPLIDDNFRDDPRNLTTFLGLFQHETGLTHTLRKMHSSGVLGAFLPVFGIIEGQMQHDLFHAYTVDAHTLMVIRNLRRSALEKFEHELPAVTELMQRTTQRYRLYLAALFHDIAKGRGGNHDKLGAVDARAYADKLSLAKEDAELIEWLVLNHLKMSKVSQREDLSDPQTIQNFAALVGDQIHLDNLYLLTVADIRGTSATTWTAWKGHLLSQLHRATSELLSDQTIGPANTAEQIRAIQSKTIELLNKPIDEHTLNQYWDMLDEDYFLTYTPKTIAWHASAICHASALDLPVVETRYLSEFEAEQYLIYTADSDVLLSTLTGVIDQFSQNILQARIHAANPGFTILIFTVNSEHGVPDDETVIEHTDEMRSALLLSRDHPAPIKKLLPRRLKEFSVKPKIRFSGTKQDAFTIMSITALDQPGLVHLIATALASCRVRLLSAHITTVGEKAEDRFIICQPTSLAPLSDKQKECLQSALLKTL